MANLFSSFNRWTTVTAIVALYVLVVLVAMFTNQPPETMKLLLEGGAGVGFVCVIIVLFG
ncbi:MAG: hypothetical protein HYT65_01075 [Candidatus Yanofskybacteria bacterium]|nr:hypothetical protein [Candidatus Yanofskybacteria bacterium]